MSLTSAYLSCRLAECILSGRCMDSALEKFLSVTNCKLSEQITSPEGNKGTDCKISYKETLSKFFGKNSPKTKKGLFPKVPSFIGFQ